MKKIILIIVSYISLVAGIMFICTHISNKDQPKKIIFQNEQDELLLRRVIGKPEGQLNMDDALKGYNYFSNIFLDSSPYNIDFETGEISGTQNLDVRVDRFLNGTHPTLKILKGLVAYYNESTGENLTTDELLRAMASMEIIDEDEKAEKFNEWCSKREKSDISCNRDYYLNEIFTNEEQ